MKVYRIIDIPDLKKAIDPNDMAIRQKYESETSLVIQFAQRFPIKKDMPAEPKNLMRHPAYNAMKKTLQELNSGDRQLLRMFFQHAIEHDSEIRLKRRKADLREQLDEINREGILKESETYKLRLVQEWVKRVNMGKLFTRLKIESLDEFKMLARCYHDIADDQHRVQIKEFMQQFGVDPAQFPAPIKYMQLTGKDDLIQREQALDDRMRLINLSDVRLRMAQLQAAANLAHQDQAQRLLNTWIRQQTFEQPPTEVDIKKIK